MIENKYIFITLAKEIFNFRSTVVSAGLINPEQVVCYFLASRMV